MQVSWNYQSQSNDMQSLSWAYKLDEDFYGTSTSATQVDGDDEVDGSSWLSGLTADGGSHTLYVALLDQGSNVLAEDHHTFTYNAGSDSYSSGGNGYQSGDGGTQSGDGGYQSGDSGYQTQTSSYNGPTEWKFTNAGAEGSYGPTQSHVDSNYSGTSLDGQVTINTQGIQEWTVPVSGSYKIETLGASGGTNAGLGAKIIGYFDLSSSDVLKIVAGQMGVTGTNSSGGGGGTFVVKGNNALIIAGGGGGGYRSTNASLVDASINTSGNNDSGTASGNAGGTNGNGGNAAGIWGGAGGAGFLENGQDGSTNSSTATIGGGKSWANGMLGGVLTNDSSGHGSNGGFGGGGASSWASGGGGGYSGGAGKYSSGNSGERRSGGGGGSYNSGTNQYNEAGVNSGHGQVIITLVSSSNNPSTGDSISIHYPDMSILYSSEYNGMQVQWNYQSRSNDMQSLSWAYKLDEDFYGSGISATQVYGNDSVGGSTWLSSISADGQTHTLYVALLDPSDGSILATDSHQFSLTSSSDPQDPGTSSDDITIINPGSGSVIERNATLSVDLSYASEVSSSESPRWAYKINEDFQSTQTSAIEVNSTSVHGWLDDLEDGEHTVYVALLMTYGGDHILAEDNVTFELVGEDDEVPPYFSFTSYDLLQITGRADLAEGNYTILMDHDGSQSSNFKIAPVFEDENGYILVDMDRTINATFDFASLETYLDANQIIEEGFVDFLPFNFQPIDRIDFNNSSELQSLLNGYDNIFYQEFTPRSWQGYDDFNGTSLDTNKWDYAYFAGGVSASISNGKGVLSGNSSTGSDSYYLPDFMEMNESDLPNDHGNSALFIHDQDVFGVELDITIPSSTNTQEVGFFIDIIDTTTDIDRNHHEIIELSWRSNGLNWNWDYKDEQNQTVYKQKDAELDQTYRLSVIQNGLYTFISIDGNRSAVFRNEFTPMTWMIGAFNDAGQEFEVEIDNVRVLKSSTSNSQAYWAISIEQGHDYDENISDLVVDMAGYVYEGHFGDYWYHWFDVVTEDPASESEHSGNPNWFEVHYPINSLSELYSNHSVVGEEHLHFKDSEFEVMENNDVNASIGQLEVSLPKLLGNLSFTITSSSQGDNGSPVHVYDNGSLTLSKSLDYETQSEYSINVVVFDEFDRNHTELITLYVEDEYEDLDNDGLEDHQDDDIDGDDYSNETELEYGLDPNNPYSKPELPIVQTLSPVLESNGSYRLKGKVLSKGGVPLNELGFILTDSDSYSKDYIYVDSNLPEGSEFSVLLPNPAPGKTYTYKSFGYNIAGELAGAPRSIYIELSSADWWYGADELEGGWKSNWIGTFLPQTNGWAYHTDLGWAFISPDSDGGIWLWVEDNGWHWTRDGIWPFMWSNNTSDWMYLMKSGTRTFIYDYSSESFITDF